jgi:hypothetical protein
MKNWKFSSAFFLLLSSMLLFSLFASSEEPGSIAGKWKLNEKESDDAREKIQNAMKDKMKSGGHGGLFGGMRDHGLGGNRGSMSGMKEHMEAPELMTITFDDPAIRITDEDAKEQIFYVDGRKSEKVIDDRTVSYTSKWEDDSLIVEFEFQNGGKFMQTYYLSTSGKQLYVKLRMKPVMLDEAITIVRVYDFVPAEDATSQ